MREVARRELLPARRQSETLNFRAGGVVFTATMGYYEDGRLGEVFLNAGKIASETDVAARDSAVVLSIALQHGVSVEAVRAALTRRADGTPEGPMGILLDVLAARPAEPVDRGRRYPLELNGREYADLPVDMQQVYAWRAQDRKWVMAPEWREKFARESE